MRSRRSKMPLAAVAPAVLLAAALALACRPGPPTTSQAAPAAERTSPAVAADPAAAAPCYRVVPMAGAEADEGRRQIECGNGGDGGRFTLRRAADGKWYQEMKVRAGVVPGYATPEAAGKALCGCP
jgi:hypothetical protein